MALSPFENPVPNGYIEIIQAYARDLAWGVTQRFWNRNLRLWGDNPIPVIKTMTLENGEINLDNLTNDMSKFFKKWFPSAELKLAPSLEELIFWGLVSATTAEFVGYVIHLEKNAFDLLIQPLKAPNIFISYRRVASSAFALAIEARFHLVGHRDVFVDKDIEAGKEWLKVLDQKITECDYFVLLVDSDVFSSKWILDEYNFAVKLNKTIIPIVHPEVDINKFSEFNKIQVIDCRGKASAASYEDAINRLLNRLGYSTY